MEQYFDDRDDREYLARRARRKRKLLEKKKRRRRRLIASMVLGLCVITAAVFGIVGVIKSKAEKERAEQMAQAQAETLAEQETEIIQEEIVEDAPPTYSFEETEDTVNIYSENVISSHAILIDESTDTIIASKGAKERMNPASMTKVLTVLVAAEHITEEQLDDIFTMTIDITDYAFVNDCSNVGFLVDEKIPVRDLFYGTILPSGGDASVGLATYVAGSHEAFVDLMNEKLEELGLSDSAHFTNCVGLYDANHYCTIYDMAVIMKAALQNELCREILGEKCYTTTPTSQHPEGITISNWFLRRIEDKDTNGEVLGAKTGFVAESGSCAVSYQLSENGTSYICATAGSTSSWRCIYDHVEIYTRYISAADTENHHIAKNVSENYLT